MTVGKKSCIAPGVAEGKRAGASVSGKGVKVASMGATWVACETTVGRNFGVEDDVGDGIMSCGVGTGLADPAHPVRKIIATGRITRRRFMVWKLGETSMWLLA